MIYIKIYKKYKYQKNQNHLKLITELKWFFLVKLYIFY